MAARRRLVLGGSSFETVADFAPGMMWTADPDGSRTFFNRMWVAFTGRACDEALNGGWLESVHDDDRSRCAAEYEAGIRSGRRFEWEYRLRRHDGTYSHVLDHAAPCAEAGIVTGFVGLCLDIEGPKADVALRESETRFRLLTENAADVIYRYRVYPTFGTEYISPAARAICGRDPEEFLANPDLAFELVHPADREAAMAMRNRPDELRKPAILRWLHADGRVVWTEHRARPIFDAGGRFVAIEGIARDISDRVLAETQFRESQRQLRRLTAAIAQARENERTLIARELHDELGQSLTAIKLEIVRMSRTIAGTGGQPGTIDTLQAVVGAVDVAVETVRRLATSLRPPALDDVGLVGAIEIEAAALARRTGVRCRVAGNRELPPLDPAQITSLFRIVQEALTNIVRHASASAVRIWINGSRSALSIKVKDNGRGMNPNQPSPHGVGLAGMRERAEMIGARLDISSDRGKGTCVSIALNRRTQRRKHAS
jgi:two-component system sensor histidine kinase UhpB